MNLPVTASLVVGRRQTDSIPGCAWLGLGISTTTPCEKGSYECHENPPFQDRTNGRKTLQSLRCAHRCAAILFLSGVALGIRVISAPAW